MSVLIDSSTWIAYFRDGACEDIDRLLDEDLVVINEVILSELVPALMLHGHTKVIEGLKSLELIPLNIDWTIIQEYQFVNLKNGINKVGIPDLIILQQVIEENLHLYSLDKHFRLMQDNFEFKIFE